MHLPFKTLISGAALALLCSLTTQAQTYKLPGQHAEQHADYIAKQEEFNADLDISVNNYLDFTDEEEPELDIYTEGWDSGLVNCYQGIAVPQTAVIDVSKYSMPCPGYMTSPYGYRKRFRRMHKGVDLKVNVGDTIRAAFDGKVRLTKYERKGYGYYVVLRHTNDLETVYGHLSKFLVEPDQYVKAGDPIALGGNTGRSTGPHLHFETRYMGYAINPAAIFDFANQTTHTDLYTFDKNTYQKARNFSPEANQEYARHYQQEHPNVYTNTKAASDNTGSKYYKVKKGDTLSSIAKKNHVTVNNLCKLNGLTTKSTIRAGQTLRLK